MLTAHYAIRALMHEAALGALPKARDPDTLSFTHALRVSAALSSLCGGRFLSMIV